MTVVNLRLTRIDWAILLVAFAARLTFALFTGFVTDDAFISFRYAENLADGLGFVYNAGVRVLGTTAPLWTLLLAVGSAFGLPLVSFAIATSILCGGISAVLIRRIGEQLELGWAATASALVYALWPRSIMAETTGMESALFTTLVLAGLACAVKRRDVTAAVLSAFAALVRPEGLVLLLLCLLSTLVRDVKRGLISALIALAILAPWVTFASWYFGGPVPSSIGGKLSLYGTADLSGMFGRLAYVLALYTPIGVVITVLAMIGSFLIMHRKPDFGVAIAFMLALVMGYAIAPTHVFFWYLAPIQPVIILIAIAAARFASKKAGYPESSALILVGTVLTVALAAWGNIAMFKSAANQQQQQVAIHRSLGEYLKDRVSDEAVVAAEDIGYIGYYSKCRILDRDGLVSPGVQGFNRTGGYYGVIEKYQPDWLVADTASPISGFLTAEEFNRAYTQDTSFHHSGRTYHVYRRSR